MDMGEGGEEVGMGMGEGGPKRETVLEDQKRNDSSQGSTGKGQEKALCPRTAQEGWAEVMDNISEAQMWRDRGTGRDLTGPGV